MKERSFDEMIAYFNRRVSEMDIAQDYKMELLGMVTALGVKHKKSAQPEIIMCKDCKHFVEDVWAVMNGLPVIVCHEACYRWSEDGNKVGAEGFCCLAERKEADG